jgi:DNA replication protein DnaC
LSSHASISFGAKRIIVITGKAGTGKSHILKALCLRACEQGIRMRYARCVDLLDDLHAGLADGSYPQRLIPRQ